MFEYSIKHRWNSEPIVDHRPVQLKLSSTSTKDHLLIEIDAPFFNDAAPPLKTSDKSIQPGPYAELWNYEVVELFFLSSLSNHYLELEFSPHGHYLVLLLVDRRKVLKDMLTITDFQVEFPSTDRWIGRASIPRSLFPAHVDRFNAFAIHGDEKNRIYEALYPATSDNAHADFHRLEFFQSIQFDSLVDVGDNDGDYWKKN